MPNSMTRQKRRDKASKLIREIRQMEVHASPSEKQMSKFQDRLTRLLETKSFKAKMHKRMGTVRQAPFETSRRIKTQEQRICTGIGLRQNLKT